MIGLETPRPRVVALCLAALLCVAPLAAFALEPDAPPVAAPVGRTIDLAAERLAKRVSTALAHPDLAGAKIGLIVRDARTGATLFERGADTPLAPASNMKLVTAGAVIELLGPERMLSTKVLADHAPDAEGNVGKVYVVGGGDPSLSVENLYGIARALASQGVRKVQGIVADDSYFAGTCRPGSWSERNCNTWYGAPCSALAANANLVAVHARAGAAGKPVATWVDPFPAFFEVQSQVRSGSGPWRVQSTLSVDPQGHSMQVVTITGRVRSGRTARVLVPVEDPPLFCAQGLAESLRRVGVAVEDEPVRGVAPPKATTLHVHRSRPLSVLLEEMNKDSSNVYAETFLKLLGAEVVGVPGTREKGLEALKGWLEHVSPGGCACHLEDGSGLSPKGRLTSRMLADVLDLMTRRSFAAPEFLVTLPVGGVDGTLRRRFRDPAARRLIRAKTGRINQVAALSGLARLDADREAVFSMLLNDYRCASWKAEDAVDRVVEAIVAEAPRVEEPKVVVEEPVEEEGDDAGEDPATLEAQPETGIDAGDSSADAGGEEAEGGSPR